jgi:NAD(P)-dependent dehydrogenase (short-subunit alcohol dehydrogenase family)
MMPTMDLGLEGKSAVVTGASRGIGLATARALAAEGARVTAGARTRGPDVDGVEWVEVDLAQAGGPERLVEAAGGVDVLVNNVGGGATHEGPLAPTDADWIATLELNLLSAVRACRVAVPSMLERGGGAIVSVSSVNGFYPEASAPDYSAAKAGLVSFSKALANACAAQGIRVNVVSPGVTATPMWLGSGGVAAQVAAATGGTREEAIAEAAAFHPIGRLLEPEELATMIVLLASGRASGVTGVDLHVDGGLTPTT